MNKLQNTLSGYFSEHFPFFDVVVLFVCLFVYFLPPLMKNVKQRLSMEIVTSLKIETMSGKKSKRHCIYRYFLYCKL